MNRILHDFDTAKKELMRRGFDALVEGGVLVAIDTVIDDERRARSGALLMSLNMLVQMDSGCGYTGREFDYWAREIGFKRTRVVEQVGSQFAAIAYK